MKKMSRYSEETIPVKLNEKDREILFEMDFNARISYSELAAKVGLSKQGVEYKVEQLIKKGVIKGFYPVINVPKLGYMYCRFLVTLQNVTKEKQEEIIKYLVNHKKVLWLIQVQGMYDLVGAVWAKSITEFKDFSEEFENKFGNYIRKKNENIATDVIHYQHRYLLGIKKTKEIHIKETQERVEIDELGKKILNILCSDARISYVDLAKKVNQSPKVIAYRIKKMERKRLIEGYRPIIDHKKIGYTYYKILINLNKTSKREMERLKKYIQDNPLVVYMVEGVGLPADLDIEMIMKSGQELFNFIEEMKFKFPTLLGEYNPLIFSDTLKIKYLPF